MTVGGVDQKGFAHLLLLIVLLIGLAVGVYLVQQRTNLFPKAFDTAESVDQLTNQLLSLNSQSTSRSAQDTSQISKMLSVAEKRKQILLKEAGENPSAFLSHTRLDAASFPSEVRSLVEQVTTLDGEFNAFHADDFDKKVGTTDYNLQTPSKTYQVYFRSGDPNRVFPKRVSITGVTLDNVIVLSFPNQISSRSAQDFTAPKNIKLAVILFTFSNSTGNPFTKDAVTEAVLTGDKSIRKYYQEVSFNQLNLEGTVFDWIKIEANNQNDCNYEGWGQEAQESLKARGVDLSLFTHQMFIFPESNKDACSRFSGIANLGGNRTWINGNIRPSVMAHELGHNLGMHHANILNCQDKAIDQYAKCSEYEYGDDFDVMGFSYHHLNAPHKASLGWLPQEKIQTITGDGVYKISPLEKSSSTYPQTLRIPKGNINDDYYLEYRQPIGFDADLFEAQGTIIHIANEDRNGFTKVLRVSPDKNFPQSDILSDGQGFLDSVNGISIQQLSHDSDLVTVSVRFTPPAVSESSLLSPWKKTQNPLNNTYFNKLVSANGWLFGLQSYNPDATAKTKIRTDGSLGEWAAASSNFSGLSNLAMASSGEYLYFSSGNLSIVGPAPGKEAVSTPGPNIGLRVRYAKVNGDGQLGSWIDAPALPTGQYPGVFEVIDDQLVVLVEGDQRQFYIAKINSDNSLGEWRPGPSLPNDQIYGWKVAGGDNQLFMMGTEYQGIAGDPKPQLFMTSLGNSGVSPWAQVKFLWI